MSVMKRNMTVIGTAPIIRAMCVIFAVGMIVRLQIGTGRNVLHVSMIRKGTKGFQKKTK